MGACRTSREEKWNRDDFQMHRLHRAPLQLQADLGNCSITHTQAYVSYNTLSVIKSVDSTHSNWPQKSLLSLIATLVSFDTVDQFCKYTQLTFDGNVSVG